ncbi:MAG: sulfite exporter TauE/SafE family protein [Betaproteobacteria bacterium]|nr:MAG: sulfite exporter TauE/SafE family protein [Betaproteobacteria bacterium]
MISGEWWALAAIALAVGFFIGAVGVGGVLLIPAMVWLTGVPIHLATATALFSFLFTGLAGSWLFQRRGSIDWRITRPVLVGALVFSYFGARVNALIDAQALTLIIASIIIFAGAYVLLPLTRGHADYRDGRSRSQQWLLLLVGAVAGFGSGLSGAGGPLFSVPMMLVLGFVPLAAIGASQVLQIFAALSGTLGNLQFGAIDFTLAGWITLFELAGAVAGVRTAHSVSVTVLRRTAAGLCVLTGLLMLARSL